MRGIVVLSEMHPDQGDQLLVDLYLSRAARAAEGGAGGAVCELWVPGVLVWGLSCEAETRATIRYDMIRRCDHDLSESNGLRFIRTRHKMI